MKIFASLFAAVLLLTSCGQSAPTNYTDGKVVNCNSVKHVDGSAIELLCLGDGSVIDMKSLRGPMLLNIWSLGADLAKRKFHTCDVFMINIKIKFSWLV
jgi:hypothetical protein